MADAGFVAGFQPHVLPLVALGLFSRLLFFGVFLFGGGSRRFAELLVDLLQTREFVVQCLEVEAYVSVPVPLVLDEVPRHRCFSQCQDRTLVPLIECGI